MKLTPKKWAAVWDEFDASEYKRDAEFQRDMQKKHGKQGHFYMDDDASWEMQKRFIQRIVNRHLKELT
jgi:hypothetical protein